MNTDTIVVVVAVIAVAALIPLVFIASVSVTSRGSRNRTITLPAGPVSSSHPSASTDDLMPHMHIVDGVVITHSHARGDKAHEHTSITVSMKHYAELVKRAEQHHTR